jgi:COP9 signalosome complex subunit 1
MQTNLIKESIRMGYNDIGDFYYSHGHLSEAFKSYVRTRDYCTTSKHVAQMCMNVILVSIQLGQFAHVTNYVSKAEQTSDPPEGIIIEKLRAAAGLAYLETKKYKLAARKVCSSESCPLQNVEVIILEMISIPVNHSLYASIVVVLTLKLKFHVQY